MNHDFKFKICNNINIFEKINISELMEFLNKEIDAWSHLMSANLYNKLKEGSTNGKINEIFHEIEFLESLKDDEILKNDWSLYYILGSAYCRQKEYDIAKDAYQKALQFNLKKSEIYVDFFELQLIQNQPFNQTLEKKYTELFQNQKETFIHYEMLKILQDIVQNREVDIEGWVQKYRGVKLGWSFDELREWIDRVQDEGIRDRLEEALGVFEGHGR